MEEMVKFTTTENLKTNKIYLDNWRPDSKNSNWSKSVEFIELQPKCSLETFFNANFENPMGTWRGGYEKKGVHQARIAKIVRVLDGPGPTNGPGFRVGQEKSLTIRA